MLAFRRDSTLPAPRDDTLMPTIQATLARVGICFEFAFDFQVLASTARPADLLLGAIIVHGVIAEFHNIESSYIVTDMAVQV